MTMTDVFLVAGYLLLVATVALFSVSARYYVRQDVRGVQDDLSGRKRQKRIEAEALGHEPNTKPASLLGGDESFALVPQEMETVVEDVSVSAEGTGALAEEQPTVVESAGDAAFVILRDIVVVACTEEKLEGAVA